MESGVERSKVEWSTHPGNILVASLRVNSSVGYHILEGVVRETTITSLVTLGSWGGARGGGHMTWSHDHLGESHDSLEQSTRFCSLRETSCPVALKCCPSREPVAEKAQQEPQEPWEGERGGRRWTI